MSKYCRETSDSRASRRRGRRRGVLDRPRRAAAAPDCHALLLHAAHDQTISPRDASSLDLLAEDALLKEHATKACGPLAGDNIDGQAERDDGIADDDPKAAAVLSHAAPDRDHRLSFHPQA